MTISSAPKPYILVACTAIGMMLSGRPSAAAEDVAVSFEVPDRHPPAPKVAVAPAPHLPAMASLTTVSTRLPVPTGRVPPVATGRSRTFATVPPPPTIAATAGVVARYPQPQPTAPAPAPSPAPPPVVSPPPRVVPAVDFSVPPAPTAAVTTVVAPRPASAAPLSAPPSSLEEMAARLEPSTRTHWIFAGGSQSLVARAIGHAEGTRTATGDYTMAYNGHRDPGNGKHNLGTFSYQHGAPSPEAADRLQLNRLRQQHQTLQAKANQHRLKLTLAEELNALDLANQSPRAALSEMGYMDRLAQAQQMGLRGEDAVLWARTRSFLDPDTGRWNASGLGNDGDRIRRDQERRMRAIATVMRTDQIAVHLAPLTPVSSPPQLTSGTLAPGDVAQSVAQADAAQHPLFQTAAGGRVVVAQADESALPHLAQPTVPSR